MQKLAWYTYKIISIIANIFMIFRHYFRADQNHLHACQCISNT